MNTVLPSVNGTSPHVTSVIRCGFARSAGVGVLVAALGASSGGTTLAAGAPRFSSVVATIRSPSGTEERCLAGEFPPGVDVLLLGARGSSTCYGRTGGIAEATAGGARCTVVLEAAACTAESLPVAAIGAGTRRYRIARRVPVKDPVKLRALAKRIQRAGSIAAILQRTERWGAAPALQVEGLTEAYAFDFGGPSPVFVRYGARELGTTWPGPLVVVENGHPTTPFSACAPDPVGFTLGSIAYVYGASECCDCGAVRDEIFAMTEGRLVRVHSSYGRSD